MSVLAKLAHLDRCLFPADFRDDLVSMGVDELTAEELSKVISDGKGIVATYQRALRYREPHRGELTSILDTYFENFAGEKS